MKFVSFYGGIWWEVASLLKAGLEYVFLFFSARCLLLSCCFSASDWLDACVILDFEHVEISTFELWYFVVKSGGKYVLTKTYWLMLVNELAGLLSFEGTVGGRFILETGGWVGLRHYHMFSNCLLCMINRKGRDSTTGWILYMFPNCMMWEYHDISFLVGLARNLCFMLGDWHCLPYYKSHMNVDVACRNFCP